MNDLFKLIVNITIVLTITFSPISYAYNNNGFKGEADEQVFCPKQIDCSEEGNIGSCKAIGGDLQYWGIMRENGRIASGEYTFSGVSSDYQIPPGQERSTACSYQNTTTRFGKTLSITVKKEANYLEAPIDNISWNIGGYRGSCGASSIECPLVRASAMGIKYNYNFKSMDGYYVYVNETIMPFYYQTPDFILVDYERALPYCGKTLCKFDFKGWKAGVGQFDIGNIIVDMNNNMKILQVNSLPSNGFFIKQADGLNNIEIIETYN